MREGRQPLGLCREKLVRADFEELPGALVEGARVTSPGGPRCEPLVVAELDAHDNLSQDRRQLPDVTAAGAAPLLRKGMLYSATTDNPAIHCYTYRMATVTEIAS